MTGYTRPSLPTPSPRTIHLTVTTTVALQLPTKPTGEAPRVTGVTEQAPSSELRAPRQWGFHDEWGDFHRLHRPMHWLEAIEA